MSGSSWNAVLALDYDSKNGRREWSNVPNHLWWKLVQNAAILGIDGFGLQNVSSSKELVYLPAFQGCPRTAVYSTSYPPYHGHSSSSVGVFAFDSALTTVLLSYGFDQWTSSNDDLSFDEILLFSGNRLRVLAVPYENLIFFYDLSKDKFRKLCLLSDLFRNNLYQTDLTSLLSNVLGAARGQPNLEGEAVDD